MDEWLTGAGGRMGERGVTASGYRASCRGDDNVLILMVVMDVQLGI